MWLIYNARPGADLSRLPTVVRTAMAANDSLLRFYYVPLGPFGADVASNLRPSQCVYWTLCWDSNNDVDRSYYTPQHTRGGRYAFVRMDHVGPLPIASNWECSWEEVRGYIDNSILETALNLHKWSVNVRQLGVTMRRRSNCIARNMQRIIERSVWLRCYWCDHWVENPVIIDWTGGPLCNACYGWYVAGGGPYEPTALQRIERQLRCVRPTLPEILCKDIASFLHNWHEP